MAELTAYERALVEVMAELRDCPEVETREGITLAPSFQECFFRFEELRSTWGTPDELFSGEFFIENIHRALIDATPPPLWYDPSPEELRLTSTVPAISRRSG
ncbi:hypothetical protein [Amycolatopsis sp. NPDC051128]|uniref:hypothetical protein n=1 Tax=Amycolatopsis sp. NPDC051128 TaxID=3155412 RepID=UPI00342F6834